MAVLSGVAELKITFNLSPTGNEKLVLTTQRGSSAVTLKVATTGGPSCLT